MSLAAPEDLPEPDSDPVEPETTASDSGGSNEPVTVEIDGETLPIAEAVESHREMLDNPDDHGVVPETRINGHEEWLGDLTDQITELEDQVSELRDAVRFLGELNGKNIEFES